MSERATGLPRGAGAARFSLPPDHPVFAGHFPGRPLVPGALLLDAVLAAMDPEAAGIAVESARFLAPVAPGEEVSLAWTADGAFAGRAGGRAVLRGRARA